MGKQKCLIIFSIISFFHVVSIAQINFQIGNTVTNAAGETCLPVTVENFENVIGFQFTIAWNSSELQFNNITNFGLASLDETAFNLSNTSSGFLTAVWDEPTLVGQNLPDQAILFELCFTALGNPTDVFSLNFSDVPTSTLVVQIDGLNIIESIPNQSSGSITVSTPIFTANENIEQILCFGDNSGSITVEIQGGSPPYTYTWNPTLPNSNMVTNLSSGTYELTVTDDFGDTLITSFEVTQPVAALGLDNLDLPDLTCQNITGTVTILATGGTAPYSYELNGETSTTGIFENIAANNYTLTITDDNGCQFVDMFIIEDLVMPTIELTGDTLSCGNPINLTSTGSTGTYEWFLDGNTINNNQNTLEVLTSGFYEVIVTNSDLCTATASISVVFAPAIDVIIDAEDFEICLDDTVTLIPQGAATYTWSGDNLQINDDQTASFSSPESGIFVFNLTAEDEFNCHTESASIEIFVFESLGFAGADTCIAKGATIELRAFEGVAYEWEENEFGLSNLTIANPNTTPDSSTHYVVQIEDINGCLATDSIVVSVIENPTEFFKLINVITPNGDGENDLLAFENLEKFPVNKIVIFNRWGSQVYSQVQYTNDWDGTYEGKKLPTGTYYYILTINDQKLKSALTILNN